MPPRTAGPVRPAVLAGGSGRRFWPAILAGSSGRQFWPAVRLAILHAVGVCRGPDYCGRKAVTSLTPSWTETSKATRSPTLASASTAVGAVKVMAMAGQLTSGIAP